MGVIEAVKQNATTCIHVLIKYLVNINATENNNNTALIIAVEQTRIMLL